MKCCVPDVRCVLLHVLLCEVEVHGGDSSPSEVRRVQENVLALVQFCGRPRDDASQRDRIHDEFGEVVVREQGRHEADAPFRDERRRRGRAEADVGCIHLAQLCVDRSNAHVLFIRRADVSRKGHDSVRPHVGSFRGNAVAPGGL